MKKKSNECGRHSVKVYIHTSSNIFPFFLKIYAMNFLLIYFFFRKDDGEIVLFRFP